MKVKSQSFITGETVTKSGSIFCMEVPNLALMDIHESWALG